jgi:hypothetical protein
VHFLLLCCMLCFEILESATQFNREYKRFFGKPRCETFERFFLRVLRNSNWSVVAESVFVAFTYGRKPALWVLANTIQCVLSESSANLTLQDYGRVPRHPPAICGEHGWSSSLARFLFFFPLVRGVLNPHASSNASKARSRFPFSR